MKCPRFMVWMFAAAVSTAGFAQSDMHKAEEKAAVSDAQKSFTQLKTLAAVWQGPVTMTPPQPDMDNGKPVEVPRLVPETEDEIRRHDAAKARRRRRLEERTSEKAALSQT